MDGKDFRNKNLKFAFEILGECAKNYFKSLREKYLRIKKNIENNTRSGAGAPKEKEWQTFQLMSFLAEIIRPRKTTGSFNIEQSQTFSNTNTETNSVEIEIETDISMDDMLHSDIISPSTSFKSVPVCSPGSVIGEPHSVESPSEPQSVQGNSEAAVPTLQMLHESKKRKRGNNSDISSVSETLKSICSSLKPDNLSTPSATESFCQFLLNEMEKLPVHIMEDFKDEIMLLLIEKRKMAKNLAD